MPSVEALIESRVLALSDVDTGQVIDLHDIYEFQVVEVGTPVMKKIRYPQQLGLMAGMFAAMP